MNGGVYPSYGSSPPLINSGLDSALYKSGLEIKLLTSTGLSYAASFADCKMFILSFTILLEEGSFNNTLILSIPVAISSAFSSIMSRSATGLLTDEIIR
jgi:hypothetical protein